MSTQTLDEELDARDAVRDTADRINRLTRLALDLAAALSVARGYMLNAKIDLETGAPKRTALATIAGGLKIVDAAIAKAEART